MPPHLDRPSLRGRRSQSTGSTQRTEVFDKVPRGELRSTSPELVMITLCLGNKRSTAILVLQVTKGLQYLHYVDEPHLPVQYVDFRPSDEPSPPGLRFLSRSHTSNGEKRRCQAFGCFLVHFVLFEHIVHFVNTAISRLKTSRRPCSGPQSSAPI